MIRLALAGPHSAIFSSLCASCPYSPAGCCVAPPRLDLADLGRIVSLGGRDFLLEEIARGNLAPRERWLVIRRRKATPRPDGPRVAACVYHGPSGCTIPHDRRAATCNYYVCEDALSRGAASASSEARALHAELVERYVAWEAEITARLERAWPEGFAFDAAFLDWLGTTFEELTRLERR